MIIAKIFVFKVAVDLFETSQKMANKTFRRLSHVSICRWGCQHQYLLTYANLCNLAASISQRLRCQDLKHLTKQTSIKGIWVKKKDRLYILPSCKMQRVQTSSFALLGTLQFTQIYSLVVFCRASVCGRKERARFIFNDLASCQMVYWTRRLTSKNRGCEAAARLRTTLHRDSGSCVANSSRLCQLRLERKRPLEGIGKWRLTQEFSFPCFSLAASRSLS